MGSQAYKCTFVGRTSMLMSVLTNARASARRAYIRLMTNIKAILD